jgi:hypothetical protein
LTSMSMDKAPREPDLANIFARVHKSGFVGPFQGDDGDE